jgi:hypothetical protein
MGDLTITFGGREYMLVMGSNGVAESAAQRAEAAAAAATGIMQDLLLEIGTDLSDLTTADIGDLFTAGSFASTSNLYFSKPLTQAGFITSASVGINGGGTGQIMLLAPPKTAPIADLVQAVTAMGGANTWPISGSPYMPVGSRVAYKRLTGGGPSTRMAARPHRISRPPASWQ